MVENTKWIDTYLFEKYVARWRGNENILSQFYIIAFSGKWIYPYRFF